MTLEAGHNKTPFPALSVQEAHHIARPGAQHFHQMSMLRAGQMKGLPPKGGSQIKCADVAHLQNTGLRQLNAGRAVLVERQIRARGIDQRQR